jgi:hypothetical protein
MNIHEAQMYVNLAAACKRHGDGLNNETVEALYQMSIKNHCGNGYWSFDGLLDDLTELTGDEDLASVILNEAA